MARDYPLEKVRNFGIVAPVVAAAPLPETQGFPGFALLSSMGKLQFSRPLSTDVSHAVILP